MNNRNNKQSLLQNYNLFGLIINIHIINKYTYFLSRIRQKMSASKSRSPYFYSPLKVQVDQKEIIISQLKEQIYLLQKNEQQFYILEDQYRNLDHKYRLLSEEKLISDADFKERHQLALRTLCQLKNQIDSLRSQLRERNLEIGDLQIDENTLKKQIDQKLIEIESLKNQLNSLLADNEELMNQKLKLQQISTSVRKDNDTILGNIKNLQLDNQSVKRKISDLDNFLNQLKREDELLREKILSYEAQNNNLDADINSTTEDINALDTQIYQAQNDIANLQTDIAQVSALNDKYKSQALHYQRASQAEAMKNNDTAKSIGQSQNTLRVRINQVTQGRKQVASLAQQNRRLCQINTQADEDLQFCKKHLENLAFLNSDLVLNLQRYSEQDEVVRNLIDRRNRVARSKSRIQESTILLNRSTNVSLNGYSPSKKSRLGY